ncbi:MAG TPA: MFS transporter [Phycisphaerales bacterium]|nr:MFS transporter [Phycisphaerales bacterium]
MPDTTLSRTEFGADHRGSRGRGAPLALSLMMFLQYAVWGVWLPYLAIYLGAPPAEGGLGFTAAQIGWILGLAVSIGAVAAPFVAGQVADRFLNAEKWLGVLLILGGVVKFATYYAHEYSSFLSLSILYSVLYMPTLALTNSIAFAHLRDPERQFPPVRTWGTIGWIVASNAFPLIWLQTNLQGTWLPPFIAGESKAGRPGLIADCLRVSGVLAVLYGLWAMLMLPRTPPVPRAERQALARAFGLLRHPGFLVCTLAALPISMIHQVYFIRTGPFLTALGFDEQHAGPIMSIGQFSEIIVLAVLGFFLARLGYRWILALGALGYAARFAIFAIATPETRELVVAAMVLHGLCYGFFFAGAYIYVERVAPKDVRHSAQTVFGIIILGAGPVLAGFYNSWLGDPGGPAPAGAGWADLWRVQALVGLGSAGLLALFFRPGREAELVRGDEAAPGPGEPAPAGPVRGDRGRGAR